MTSAPPPIPAQMDLPAVQKHLDDVCKHFGWDSNSNEKTFLLFAEEVGELAKAMRRHMRLYDEKGTQLPPEAIQANLQEELADCLIYLLDLANRYGVDLETAYREKMGKNFNRTWLD